MKTIYHIVLNNCVSDGRVLKSADASAQSGAKVTILAFWEEGLPVVEDRGNFSIHRVKVPAKRSGIIATRNWLKKVEKSFAEVIEPAAAFHCHSLYPLCMALRYRKHLSPDAKIIYDAHELETELECLSGLRKLIFKVMERRVIYKVDRMITVADRIADWYVNRYKIDRPVVVRNIPEVAPPTDDQVLDIRSHFNIPPGDLIFLYLGAFHYARGIPLMLSVFKEVRKDRHLVFVGGGHETFENMITEVAASHDNIHRHVPVPVNHVVPVASKADVGISFTEPVCLNNLYALPNKFFQSLHAGRALWILNSPEQADILRAHDAGWVANGNQADMVAWVNEVDRATIEEKQRNASRAAGELKWEYDANRVIKLYQELDLGQAQAEPALKNEMEAPIR